MAWLKLDDQFAINPKVEECSLAAIGLYVLALAESGRRLSDGRVVTRVVTLCVTTRGEDAEPLVAELVAAGLWVPDGDGWLIPDFLEYNPSSEKVLEKRAKDKERQRSHRMSQRDKQRDTAEVSRPPSPGPSARPVPLITKDSSNTNRGADSSEDSAKQRELVDVALDSIGVVQSPDRSTLASCIDRALAKGHQASTIVAVVHRQRDERYPVTTAIRALDKLRQEPVTLQSEDGLAQVRQHVDVAPPPTGIRDSLGRRSSDPEAANS